MADLTGTRGCDREEGPREELGEGVCQLGRKSRDDARCAPMKGVGHRVEPDYEITMYRRDISYLIFRRRLKLCVKARETGQVRNRGAVNTDRTTCVPASNSLDSPLHSGCVVAGVVCSVA